jgi:hypothetical protein
MNLITPFKLVKTSSYYITYFPKEKAIVQN